MRRIGWLLLLAACASHDQETRKEPAAKPVEAQPVRAEEPADPLAVAKAREADAGARVEVAKSERAVAETQLRRAEAAREWTKKESGAERETSDDLAAAQSSLRVAEAKLAFMNGYAAAAKAALELLEERSKDPKRVPVLEKEAKEKQARADALYDAWAKVDPRAKLMPRP